MPAKKRIQRGEILAAAVQVIRERGETALTVRNVARQMGCSTQPIYSEFGSQQNLSQALPDYIFREYLSMGGAGYRDFGRAFLRFAGEEKELFRFLYLRRRVPEETVLEDVNLEQTLALLAERLEMDCGQAAELHRRMQYYCYGLGTMIATGYRAMDQEEIDRELTEFFCLLLGHYKGVADERELSGWLERTRGSIG